MARAGWMSNCVRAKCLLINTELMLQCESSTEKGGVDIVIGAFQPYESCMDCLNCGAGHLMPHLIYKMVNRHWGIKFKVPNEDHFKI